MSFWEHALGGARPHRPPLPGPTDADVCVVGAGYTGLWTAWALRKAEPGLRVVVLEREHVGFGASGRNGGWLSGLMPGDRARLASGQQGRAGVARLQQQLYATVADVIAICAEEGIAADLHRGGSLAVTTSAPQQARLAAALEEDRSWGVGPDDAWPLSASEVADRVAVAGAVGGVFIPHCARVQPARLVRGLADAVTRLGAEVYEATPVSAIGPHRVVTPAGPVTARWVVRATEGFTAQLPGLRRLLLPMNSSMVVTEPLPAATWAELGWADAETLRDNGHAYAYAQRTADGRVALGGRGAPYRYGSATDQAGAVDERTVSALRSVLHRLLPATRAARLDYAWCGALGVARDWTPSVVADPASGLAWAGGYVGDGVAAAHLAGRTLADLIVGADTERTHLPWVGHRPRSWEPEPLRWAGVHAVYALYRAADRAESAPGASAPSPWARAADRLAGRS